MSPERGSSRRLRNIEFHDVFPNLSLHHQFNAVFAACLKFSYLLFPSFMPGIFREKMLAIPLTCRSYKLCDFRCLALEHRHSGDCFILVASGKQRRLQDAYIDQNV